MKNNGENFWWFMELLYLCIRFRPKTEAEKKRSLKKLHKQKSSSTRSNTSYLYKMCWVVIYRQFY